MLHKRINARLPLQKECILINPFGSIETQTADISKMGLGVKTDRTSPFRNGCELAVFIPITDKLYNAKLIWTKKDVENNATRLGLKLSTGLHF